MVRQVTVGDPTPMTQHPEYQQDSEVYFADTLQGSSPIFEGDLGAGQATDSGTRVKEKHRLAIL